MTLITNWNGPLNPWDWSHSSTTVWQTPTLPMLGWNYGIFDILLTLSTMKSPESLQNQYSCILNIHFNYCTNSNSVSFVCEYIRADEQYYMKQHGSMEYAQSFWCIKNTKCYGYSAVHYESSQTQDSMTGRNLSFWMLMRSECFC